MFAVGSSYMAITMLREVPSMPIFWTVLIINGCWIFSKAFYASIEIIIWFLSFNLLMWYIILISVYWKILASLEETQLDHGVWDFWCVAEFCLLKFCWGFLHLHSSLILASSFLFVCCLWFWYQGDDGLIERVWKCSFLCNFLKEF